MVRSPLAALALAVLAHTAACVAPATARAQSVSRDWSPEDRLVLGDFSRVVTVAAGMEGVYVVSPTAVLLWRPLQQRWEAPVQAPRQAGLERAVASLVDPLDQSLWIARPDGWAHYQPELRLWEQGSVPGVRGMAFDQDGISGLYLRTGGGWYTVARGSPVAMPSSPPARPLLPASVEEALRENPGLQANTAQVLLDQRLRPARYTSAARSVDRRGWYLGTWGLGVLFLSDASIFPQRLSFGLAGGSVGALFAAPDGVWAATDRTSQDDAAVTFVAGDLSEFRTVRGLAATGLPFSQVRRIVGQGRSLWAATDAGVVRIDGEGGDATLVDAGRGMPDSRALSLASRRGRLTVGTAHGLVRVDDSLGVHRLAPGFVDAALAVAVRNDSTWVGTPVGLFVLPEGSDDLLLPRGRGEGPTFREPVVDLAWLGETLVGLTRDRLLWRDARGAWGEGPALSSLLGRLVRIVPDGDGFWVAGERGVGWARLTTMPLRTLRIGDLPAAPTDLAVDDDHLWVGTAEGLVRFRLDAVRP